MAKCSAAAQKREMVDGFKMQQYLSLYVPCRNKAWKKRQECMDQAKGKSVADDTIGGRQ
jgi:hypothetical protein